MGMWRVVVGDVQVIASGSHDNQPIAQLLLILSLRLPWAVIMIHVICIKSEINRGAE